MFGRFERFFASVKLAVDVAVLFGAFRLAYALRFFSQEFIPFESLAPPEDSYFLLGVILFVFPLVYRWAGLYGTARSRSQIGEVFAVFKATIVATLILVALTYFLRERRYSRLVIVLFASTSFVLDSAARMLFRAVFASLRRRGFNLRNVLVVGAGELGQQVVETLRQHQELGFRVAGLLSRKSRKVGTEVDGVPVLGTLDELDAVLRAQPVHQVIIALPIEEQAAFKPLMDVLALHTVDVKMLPDIYQYVTLTGGFEEFGGLPLFSLQHGPLQGWNTVLKRVFDILFAWLAILVASPVMLLAALAVKLSSRGPVFYRQERMGMDGRVFEILKFRTMKLDAEMSGARMAIADDPRKTKTGAFMRKTSIDELPQLFNVLRGDMSLVGPRPERPVFIEEFKKQIPKYQLRHKIKAGITGWAQINGLRGNTSIAKRIEYDLYYIENWSLALDFKILVRTAFGGFLSKNAY